MTDLTVLISPTPLHIQTVRKTPFSFGRSAPCLITPVMVTLETEREGQEEEEEEEEEDKIEEGEDRKNDDDDEDLTLKNAKNRDATRAVVEEADDTPTGSETSQPPARRRGRTPSRITLDPNFLSPPINTFKSSSSSARRSRHRHTRSQSAPPGGAVASRVLLEHASVFEETPLTSPEKFIPISPSAAINNFNRSLPRRSFTSLVESSGTGKRSNGDLLPPPPPLLRPTTFWRKTRRSGVTAASYSPSYHLIRRSTFVAAGLDLDTPSHDLRAYCVENRIGFIVVPPDCSFL